MRIMRDITHRHGATQDLARRFTYGHLPAGIMRSTSARCEELADTLIATLPDCAELTVALRKLLEAKDAAVRVALDVHERGPEFGAG
jgi:hypothetical protein